MRGAGGRLRAGRSGFLGAGGRLGSLRRRAMRRCPSQPSAAPRHPPPRASPCRRHPSLRIPLPPASPCAGSPLPPPAAEGQRCAASTCALPVGTPLRAGAGSAAPRPCLARRQQRNPLRSGACTAGSGSLRSPAGSFTPRCRSLWRSGFVAGGARCIRASEHSGSRSKHGGDRLVGYFSRC